MAVTRAFWAGMGVAFPPSLLLLAFALWHANDWWLVGIVWLLCTCALLEILDSDDIPSAESLGIPDDDEEDFYRNR